MDGWAVEKSLYHNNCVHKTHLLHTHKHHPSLKGTSGSRAKIFWYPTLTLWGTTISGFRPNTFFSVCLEIIGSGFIGVYLSRLRSYQMVVTLSSTISPDTQFVWNTLGMPPIALLSQQNTFTVLKSCSYFHVSHNSPRVSLSAALSCSHFHSLSCLHPFCMCELGSQLTVHEGKLILFFCTYS